MSRNISRQLGGWAFSLQESDIKGSRYLTDKSKAGYQHRKSADDFMEKLRKQHEENLERIRQSREATEPLRE